jgi:hypothetical protein
VTDDKESRLSESQLSEIVEAFQAGLFSCKATPLPEGLRQAVEAIGFKPAREDALAILEDISHIGSDGGLRTMDKDRGLAGPAGVAKSYWERRERPNPKSPVALKAELEELGASMREVAGRIRTLSPTARHFIAMMPDYDMASEECRYQMDLWEEFNASEAFQSPFLGDDERPNLAQRLDGMAKMLNSMAGEAGRIAEEKPGTRQVFEGPPVDLKLFDSCAKVLVARNRSLKNLRPIAEALYLFVTGDRPVAYWGKRQEEEARRKYGTHPHKIG